MKRKNRVLGVLAAVGIGLMGASATAAPATAADAVYGELADTPSTQLVESNVTLTDSHNEVFELRIKTTWQRASSTQATLSTIVVEPVSMPRGDCLSLTLGSNGLDIYDNPRTLCPTGYLTWAPSKTITAANGNLGQLFFQTPDPWAPFSGGARTVTVEYST